MLIDRLIMTLVFFTAVLEVREFVGHCHRRPPFYQNCTCACIDHIIDGTLNVIFYGILLPVRYLKNKCFFRVFIIGKQEKNIRVGEFLTGSVGLSETFLFFHLIIFLSHYQ